MGSGDIEMKEHDEEEETPSPRKKRGKKKDDEPIIPLNTPLIDRQDKRGYTALFWAVKENKIEAAKLLIEKGSNVNCLDKLNKQSILSLAAEFGDLDMVKLLVEKGALVDNTDKLYKTPLIKAIINGHLPVVSYLMHMGADADAQDSSHNSVSHYAAAYGWINCLEFLIANGANANVFNDWKISPLGVAMLKGHFACADLLLNQKGVDVNITDDQGCTLLAQSCKILNTNSITQIQYLVEKKGANTEISDLNGYTPLHHLAATTFHDAEKEKLKLATVLPTSVNIAKVLFTAGANINAITKDKSTALSIAVKVSNFAFIKFLLENGAKLGTPDSGENILHNFATSAITVDLVPTFELMIKAGVDQLHELTKGVDKTGFTPFLTLIQTYANTEFVTHIPAKYTTTTRVVSGKRRNLSQWVNETKKTEEEVAKEKAKFIEFFKLFMEYAKPNVSVYVDKLSKYRGILDDEEEEEIGVNIDDENSDEDIEPDISENESEEDKEEEEDAMDVDSETEKREKKILMKILSLI